VTSEPADSRGFSSARLPTARFQIPPSPPRDVSGHRGRGAASDTRDGSRSASRSTHLRAVRLFVSRQDIRFLVDCGHGTRRPRRHRARHHSNRDVQYRANPGRNSYGACTAFIDKEVGMSRRSLMYSSLRRVRIFPRPLRRCPVARSPEKH
jgi:hypothetical protein